MQALWELFEDSPDKVSRSSCVGLHDAKRRKTDDDAAYLLPLAQAAATQDQRGPTTWISWLRQFFQPMIPGKQARLRIASLCSGMDTLAVALEFQRFHVLSHHCHESKEGVLEKPYRDQSWHGSLLHFFCVYVMGDGAVALLSLSFGCLIA